MIAKQIPMKSARKSDFGSLVRYLTDGQGKSERVGVVTLTNCESSDSEIAILEVLNTQTQNTRALSDKTFHLIVSFAPREHPDEAILREIENRICDGIGFGEHQRISVVHHDTDILHVHIAINKIHPTRYTMYDPFNVFHTLGQLCDKLESELGLAKANHKACKQRGENLAADMEQHADVESLLGWIKRECADQIDAAQSWSELHEIMRQHGLEIHPRGNGLVITAENGISVKASSVDRDFSKNMLEEKIGAFESSAERQSEKESARSYHKSPMPSRINTVELFARYKEAQKTGAVGRATSWAQASARKKRLIENAKRNGRLKRLAIRLISGPGVVKKVLYSAASKTLRGEIENIHTQYLKERQEAFNRYRRETWADWLQAEAVRGDEEALAAMRARAAHGGPRGNTLAGKGNPGVAPGTMKRDGITKKGTIIYSAGSTSIRDDGDELKVARGADQAGLQVALGLAMERYGNRITVNGTEEFKEKVAMAAAAAKLPISFGDADLERRRQQLTQSDIGKERNHEQHERGRADQGRHAGGRFATPDDAAGGVSAREGLGAESVRGIAKPNLGRVGAKPPPASQNRLRGLRELGVVQFTDRSEVLLPGHVPGHLEQQGTKSDHGLRRDVSGTGLGTDSARAAAATYVFEREQKRLTLFDIPKHIHYTFDNDGRATFGGIRHVAGQPLALLQRDELIMVLPIDEATARRLKRVKIGTKLTVHANGSIRKKGRSR